MSELMLIVIPVKCEHFRCVNCGKIADRLIIPVEAGELLVEKFNGDSADLRSFVNKSTVPVCMSHAADHLII